MSPQSPRYRWLVVGVFFFFMLLHQTNRLMIGLMQQTIEDQTTFFVLMCLTAVFMPLSSPNVIATIYDITVPRRRQLNISSRILGQ